jgi:hypothetical protein
MHGNKDEGKATSDPKIVGTTIESSSPKSNSV